MIKKYCFSNVFLKIGIILSILIVASGCSQNEKNIDDLKGQADRVIVEKNEKIIDKKSIDSIEQVLKSEFTSPKQKYTKIIQNPKNLTYVDGKKVVKASNGSELYNYVEGLYQPYFTKAGFENFFVSNAFSYTLQANDIHIKVDNISIKQNEYDDTDFNFEVKVKYSKEGDGVKNYKIKGVATIPEKGKISKITYLDDGGLMQTIRKNS